MSKIAGDGPNVVQQNDDREKLLDALLTGGNEDIEYFDLSYAQERLWFLDQLEPDSPTYNMPAAVKLSGKLHVEALEQALTHVLDRHEALRSRFSSQDGHAVQFVEVCENFKLATVDLVAMNATEKAAKVTQLAVEESLRPFNIAQDLLFRARLLRLQPVEHVLLITMHHIVSDGWSIAVLIREINALYETLVKGHEPNLPPLPIQYIDFAEWQRDWLDDGVMAKQMVYWRSQLPDVPVLALPTDYQRPALLTTNGARFPITITPQLTQSLQQFTRGHGTTLFMTLVAAFQVLLHRYTGQEDLTVGTPIANRNQVDIESLIGFFVNTLVLRADLSENPTFEEFLERVKRFAVDAYANQDLPFAKLVEALAPERDMSHTPLFQVMFILQNTPKVLPSVSGLTVEYLDLDYGVAKFDITVDLNEENDGISGAFVYNTNLFAEDTIARMATHFLCLLEGIAAKPDAKISQYVLLNDSERKQILFDWNQTECKYPLDRCIHAVFEAQTQCTPENIAVVCATSQLSFHELNNAANQLAHYLIAHGVGPETLVGICLMRSVEQIVSLLAIMKAGGAYVPIDPAYPADRISYMIADAGVQLLITQQSLVENFTELTASTFCIDRDWETLDHAKTDNPKTSVNATNAAYVIYTSGSTGKPKGVVIEHHNVLNLSRALNRAIYAEYGGPLTVAMNAPLAFDASVKQWQLLLSGHTVHILTEDLRRDARALLQYLAEQQIDAFDCTPSLLKLLLSGDYPDAPGIQAKIVLIGGEPIDESLWRRLCVPKHTAFFNVYGPTEATVNTTVTRITKEQTIANIGQPIANVKIYVLDTHMQPVPIGVPGELNVSGGGVARGYLQREELTEQCFVANPFYAQYLDKDAVVPHGSERMYRTGDLVRYLADGRVQFLGRRDHQVKLRGYRIELGEIEAGIDAISQVKESVVIVREDVPGDQRLVAYIVGVEDDFDTVSIRNHLKGILPDYMVPASYMALPKLPLNVHGKLDRKALPVPDDSGIVVDGIFEAPRNPIEEVMAAIWMELLHLDAVSVQANFFDLGGHSLLATQVISQIRAKLQVELPLRELFEYPTVAALALRLEAVLQEQKGLSAPPIVPISREHPIPLSFAQERLWFLDQLEPENPFYNIPAAVRLLGPLDSAAVEQSLVQLTERHEALRTGFGLHDGSAVQIVRDVADVSLRHIDLSDLPEDTREQEALALAHAEMQTPFSLQTDALMRATLLKLADNNHVLLLTLHHIISDGWSSEVLIRETGVLYKAIKNGDPSPLMPLTVQYADFADWQRKWLQGDVLASQIAYWTEKLKSSPAILPLPTDRPRPAVQTFVGTYWSFTISPELTNELRLLSRRQGCTLNMTLIAAFQVLLARYTAQEDICIGSPIANRNRAETEGLIGFFVNTLVIRGDLSNNPRFIDFLLHIRGVSLDAYAHQDLPFEKLVEVLKPERNLSHTPLFQVMFALQNSHRLNIDVSDLCLVPLQTDSGIAKFDLSLFIEEEKERLIGRFEYNTDLFDAGTIVRLQAHFESLLANIVEDPNLRLAQIPLLTEAEREQILFGWNDTTTEYPRKTALSRRFEMFASTQPDAIAADFGDQVLTYSELNIRANQLARVLLNNGIAKGQMIAICLQRSVDMLVGSLAILKAGGAYVPLDPDYPKDRLSFMLADIATPLVITQECYLDVIADAGAQIICCDRDRELLLAESGENLTVDVDGEALAYVIYTSGSTGQPKGVPVPQYAVMRLVVNTDYLDLGPSDRLLHASNVSFDAATFEIWGALLNGGRIIGVDKDTLLYPGKLASFIRHKKINTLFLTTALFNQIAREVPTAFAAMRYVLFGGEACDPASIRAILDAGKPEHLLHVYGPTENTTFSTWYPIEKVTENALTVPIGFPIANSTCYVLDKDREPVPMGVHGELYVGGDGLSYGYLKRQELTDERFVAHPFSEKPGALLYRTGDLVRYLPDGSIEFIGRIDHQVKIRGFRIELGEIEALLGKAPGLREAFVMVREDKPGIKNLVAYVVGNAEVDLTAIRDFLKITLPAYMLPSAIIPLDALPLTPNGKIDRAALPAENQERYAELIPPRNAIEQKIAAVWTELLGLEQIDVRDNFFEIGGHSLLATKVISRIRQEFAVELPLKTMFESPVLEDLSLTVSKASALSVGQAILPITVAPRDVPLQLSFAQERLWVLAQLEPENTAYNIVAAVRMSGALNVLALDQALIEIVNRHEVLRTTFSGRDGHPVQRVRAPFAFRLNITTLAEVLPKLQESQDLQELQEREIQKVVLAQRQTPFNLETGPMLRASLIRINENEHVAVIAMHHIASDGWSMGIFVRELGSLYESFSQGLTSSLPHLPLQYADFAVWQREWLQNDVLEMQLQYWRQKLASPPVLELPTDRPHPAHQTFNGAEIRFELEQSLVTDLEKIGQRQGATLFMTLLAAFNVLLFRYTGQTDICIGSPIAGRRHHEIEGLIGFFVNTQVLRSDLANAPTFANLLKQVSATALEAYTYQDIPFEMLVEALQPKRDISRNPLFQVMFMFQNLSVPELELAGLSMRMLDTPSSSAKFELTLTLAEQASGLWGCFEYNTDLFDKTTIARLLEHFNCLLRGIVANPQQNITNLPLLSKQEQQTLLVDWNQTRSHYPQDRCFHQLFEHHASSHPDAIALVFASDTYSYRQLNEAANQLAHYLAQRGVGANRFVGVFLQRAPQLLISILAIHKAQGAYLPLDPAYPAERLTYMVEDSAAAALLTQEALMSEVPGAGQTHVICLERIAKELAKESIANPVIENGAANLAYVIYTSGSTGKPKGVQIQHNHLLNFLTSMAEQPGFSAADVLLAVTSLSFDIATLELFLPLICGARIILADRETALDAKRIESALVQHKVSVMQATPATWKMLLSQNWQPQTPIKVLCGGEPMPLNMAQQLLAFANVELWNMYGPTETTVWSTIYQITEVGATIPIGRPIANTQIYLLDTALNPVPIGVAGELHIGGDGVARGYLQRPDLTAERFIDDPFGGVPARIYKTGDLARYRADGILECLGRMDNQVKVRGYRIELGEIETALARHAEVVEAVTIVREDHDDARLVAYLMTTEAAPDSASLRSFLREYLPDYMLPSAFVFMQSWPLTPNGKIDRKALPEPENQLVEEHFVAPRTATEQTLHDQWCEILGIERIGAFDSFFELGGHSLLATQAISRIRQQFHLELPLRQLFTSPTLADLAAHIDNQVHEQSDVLPIVAVERGAVSPLSYAQERLWFLNQLEPDNPIYNIPTAIRLYGTLDADVLAQSLAALIQRHESLRTSFELAENAEGAGATPSQRIHASVNWQLQRLNLSKQPQGVRETEVERLALMAAQTVFDLQQGPLFQASLVVLGPQEHVLLFTMHHIICDGWSIGVIIREMATLYRAFLQGEPSPLKPLPVQYADFSYWQRDWLKGEILAAQMRFWKQSFADAPPYLSLATDRPRPEVQTFNGAHHRFQLTDTQSAAIKQLATNHSCTLFMVLLAAYQLVLSRHAKQTDICVGIPIAGRNRTEIEGLIGFFVNGLGMRTNLAGNPRVSELLERVKDVALAAFANQDIPFELLVEELQPERNLSYPPLAQVGFALQNAPHGAVELPNLIWQPIVVETHTSKYDMTLICSESKGIIDAVVEYNTDLFDASTIARFVNHYQNVLTAMVANPDAPLTSISLLAENELYAELGCDQAEVEQILPLTTTQRELYLEMLLNPESRYSSLGYAFELPQNIDIKLWKETLQRLSDYQPVMRTRIVGSQQTYLDDAYQCVYKCVPVKWYHWNWEGKTLSDPDLYQQISDLVYRNWDIHGEALLYYGMIHLAGDRIINFFSSHHILLDASGGMSQLEQAFGLYEAAINEVPFKQAPAVFDRYIAYNLANFERIETRLWWQEQAQTLEPLDFPVVGGQEQVAKVLTQQIAPNHWQEIRKLCRSQRITPAIYFRALYALLLRTYCRAEKDFVIYEVSGGRFKEFNHTVGCFYQEIPTIFANDLMAAENDLTAFFAAVKSYFRDLGDHKNISLRLQHKLLPQGRIRFYYNYYNFIAEAVFMDHRIAIQQYEVMLPEDQVMLVVNAGTSPPTLCLNYNSGYFSDLDFLERLLDLSQQITKGVQLVGDLRMVNANEARQLLQLWNDSAVPAGSAESVQSLFEMQVERTPLRIAVKCGDKSLNYDHLNRKANQLAVFLRDNGITGDMRVGICLHRSLDLLVAVFAVLKAGGAYVPLDPEYPKKRLAYLLEDANIKVLLSNSEVVKQLPEHNAATFCMDGDGQQLEQLDDANPVNTTNPKDLAYVIYTSGSTGKPKGTGVEHRGVVNLLTWYTAEFAMTEADKTLIISAFGFDLTQKNLFALLTVGGEVVFPEMQMYDDQLIGRCLEGEGITLLNCAPSAFYPLVQADNSANQHLHTLRHVFLGGEPINIGRMRPWIDDPQLATQVVNTYGPTECTDIAAFYRIQEPLKYLDQPVPIGQPNHNVRLYVLDHSLSLVPVGVPGELCIGGQGVGRGYLNNPDLTAKQFITDRFSDDPTQKLYRTGDLVRYQQDGKLEYIGRLDHQVKLRGLRIELGEIETVLKALENITDALVLVKDERLIAYLIADQRGIAATDLRHELGQSLPDYMVPAVFIPLDAWPLTPNGKIDRAGLPDPAQMCTDGNEYVAPAGHTEQALGMLWMQLLGLNRIGRFDNFFDLGGHSLLATQMISQIRSQFHVELPVRVLFEVETLADLAVAIDEEKAKSTEDETLPAITPVSRQQDLVLSFAQERLWFLYQMDRDNPIYNIPAVIRIQGAINRTAITAALSDLLQRHESLRTTFAIKNDRPVQIIHANCDAEFAYSVLSDATATISDQIRQKAEAEAKAPFDLVNGPLFRVKLLATAENDHVLLFTMHHMISDGWSSSILVRDLAEYYLARDEQREPNLPPLAIQVADHAAWQQTWFTGEVRTAQLDWWRQKLADVPEILPLATDRPRPKLQTYNGNQHKFTIPGKQAKALAALCKNHDVTLFMGLLALFQVLLHRYTHEDTISVGCPIAGRNQAELEGLIGCFVNTLVMVTDLSENPAFAEILKRVRATALGAYSHQDIPFEQLVDALQPKRDMSHTPLFQVAFSLHNVEAADLSVGNLHFSPMASAVKTAKFDLTLSMSASASALSGVFEFNTDLFDTVTITRMSGHFQRLLTAVLEDAQKPIATLALLDVTESQQILVDWNATDVYYPIDDSVHRLIEALALSHAHSPAVTSGTASITYAELNAKANQLAHHLRQRGVGANQLVAVCLDRSVEMIIGMLAVWKTGGAYVPIDPAYPPDRISFMVEDAQVGVLLTQQSLFDAMPDAVERICLDTDWPVVAESKATNLDVVTDLQDVAYVIYTSGSTGKPKGVEIEQHSLLNLIHWHHARYQLKTGDRTTHVAGVAFDASVWEIWPTLCIGANLWLVADKLRTDPEKLRDWVVANEIAMSFMPTPLAERLILLEWPAATKFRALLTGGDQLHHRPPQGLPFELVNHYGPTECTVLATAATIPPSAGDIAAGTVAPAPSIGYPVANNQVYILDSNLKPVPIGVAGELHIGGAGVGRGYLRRPELTQEKFISSPFAQDKTTRIYKTGDLSRFLADGSIEYMGRIDQQVKIRGYRIELGEIEATLGRLEEITECVVIAVDDDHGNRRLAAYVVPTKGADIEIAALRQCLLADLPDYMVPSAFITLTELPMTANGKLNRKALPKPDDASFERSQFVAPRNQLEEQVAKIWSELLSVELVGIHDNFFDLGGHSLLATQVVSQFRKQFSVEVPLRALFETPTVAGVAAAIAIEQQKAGGEIATIQPVARDQDLVLSFSQERLWFIDQLEPKNAAYNIPAAIRMTGKLDTISLNLALGELLRRHESLRTTFARKDGNPVQVVTPSRGITLMNRRAGIWGRRPGEFILPLVSMTDYAEDEREAKMQELVRTEAGRAFALDRGSLFRVMLIRMARNEYVLFMNMHHIISDGWSVGVLIHEFASLYQAFLSGNPSPLLPLPIQYPDFAYWQRQWLQGETLQQQVDFWKAQLTGVTALELPTDRTRPVVLSFNGANFKAQIPAKLTGELNAICHNEGATLYMTLLAAFYVLLYRYSSQDDIAVGSPIAGRNRAEIEGLIGFFINTLVLRTDLSANPGFRELLATVKSLTLNAYANQDLPFEKLVEAIAPQRDMSRSPLFQVMFVLQNQALPSLEATQLGLEMLPLAGEQAKFDLTLTMMETPSGMLANWEYNIDLFDQTTIARMADHFLCLLRAIVADPQQPVNQLQILDDGHLRQLMLDWQATYVDSYGSPCIQQWFEQQAARTPDAPAIVFGANSMSYLQLNEKANQLAHYLRSEGVNADARVGICIQRSPQMLIGVLAILKAGGCYLPLDPGYPIERLAFMLEDANVTILLTQELLLPRLPEASYTRFCLDSGWQQLANFSKRNPELITTANNLAYVIYTSGSTGRPKGAGVYHRGVVNLLRWFTREFQLQATDKTLLVSSFGFDLTQKNLFAPLITGGSLVIPEVERYDDQLFASLIKTHAITLLNCAPSAFYPLLADASGWQRLQSLRHVFLGGEAVDMHKLANWLGSETCNTEVVNTYGPTECTDIASFYRISDSIEPGRSIPIGKPNDNVMIVILDKNLNPVPIGVIGELCIGGIGVGSGYLNNPELTATSFIEKTFTVAAEERTEKLYRTGDLARFLADGNIEYISRVDFQVKLRGLRIELGEVEYALEQQPEILDVVAVVRDDTLVAYVISADATIDNKVLKRRLRDMLPDYMVPGVFMQLDAMPLTPNGKIDRNALPKPDYEAQMAHAYQGPRNELEEQLCSIWASVLKIEKVGVDDSFFDLGGHSLLATQVISAVREQFKVEVPLRELFEEPTVENLARAIQQAQSEPSSQVVETIARIDREAPIEEDDAELSAAESALTDDLEGMDEDDLDSLLDELIDDEDDGLGEE